MLIGGVGLSFALWGWWQLQDVGLDLETLGLWGLMAVGGGMWWLRRDRPSLTASNSQPSSLTAAQLTQTQAQTEALITLLAAESPNFDPTPYQTQLQAMAQPPSGPLQVTITGGAWVGKTALLQQLAVGEGWEYQEAATPQDQTHLVLALVDGDLTAAAWVQIQQWRQAHHHIFLLLTKQDQHPEPQRQQLLDTLRQRVAGWLPSDQVFAIAAAPRLITVRHHCTDGSITETQEPQAPQLGDLPTRLAMLANHRESLIWGVQWRQLIALQGEIKTQLNQERGDRALPMIERYQWVAAAAAFANPVAALDLLASLAINAQMFLDLAQLYRQPLSLNQAQTAAASMGELLLKLGAVEVSTQAIATLLKTTPLTYAAGGLLQGISAAYLTRIVGLTLITHFAQQDPLNPPRTLNWETISQGLQTTLKQTQAAGWLGGFVQEVRSRLVSQPG
ncbi:DUF697 domain-containing protein [Spirulina sp. CCNP1310]|uniref:DUF697 domain-containing protein n=1 Tax=Spirulina sp. CCNP1310 TaxID=3110249 RepID=UPI002B1F90AB|nr:DUF697 domain-containing protein [Spirulina sp. CCNP1310]